MNRIRISPLASTSVDTRKTQKPLHCEFTDSSLLAIGTGGQQLPGCSRALPLAEREMALFLPLHYESRYAYPLIVWLHSDGDDPRQLHRVMPAISLRNYVAVAPQAALGDQHHGFYWEQNHAAIDHANDAVAAAIDAAVLRSNIATNRIFLAGSGGAGTMAFRVAFDRPELFAGVISINGALPENLTPLSRWQRSRNLEIFWAHYRKSAEFSQNQLCRQLRLLHIAGFSLTLRQYPQGDNLCDIVFADADRWIMGLIDSAIT
jgi:phospholipase/carboxylesterase